MTKRVRQPRRIRLVKIDKEHQEELVNRCNSMVNALTEREYTEFGQAEVDYNAFLGYLWDFDALVDSLSELDREQNGVDE